AGRRRAPVALWPCVSALRRSARGVHRAPAPPRPAGRRARRPRAGRGHRPPHRRAGGRHRARPADPAPQRWRRLPPPHRKTPPVEATALPEPQPLPAPITGDVLATRIAAVRDEVSKACIGQAEVLDQILVALLAGGHVLVEGVPGLGKTLLVRALAQALGC